LNQHIKEISANYTIERNQLQETISQLKIEQAQQKQEYENRIKVLTNNYQLAEQKSAQLEGDRMAMSQKLERNNKTLRSCEEQIQNLQQAKASSEQKSNDLERYIQTTIKAQMEAYETQIKVLQKPQQQEKIEFENEMNRLLKDSDALQLKVKELKSLKGDVKRESFGGDYEENLRKVVLQLDKKFKRWFKFKADGNKLLIFPSPQLKTHSL